MDSWQPSTLAWSFSRKTHFDSCRRHYFYNRFWGQDPKLRWKLYEMKNLTTLTMLRGQVVHSVVANALQAVQLGQKTDVQTAKHNITQVIRERYMESAKRLWHIDNRPEGRKASQITSILEHYYKFPNMNERARDAQQVAWKCVENLMESDFWHEIAGSDTEQWKEVEDDSYPSFDLDGIKIYATLDFAHSNGTPTIIDWKTGSKGEQDRRQLTLYSLYAKWKWGWDPLETELAAVYLQPELSIDAFTATNEDIEAVEIEAKQSFEEMRDVEPAFGLADIEAFPKTDELSNCQWCRFQGICKSAIELPDGVV